MTSRGARLSRGWTAAAFATFAALLSHLLGGGGAPSPLLVLFSLSMSALVCTALAGRVRSLPNLVAAVVLSEGLFHVLFSISAGMPASLPASSLTASSPATGMHGGMDMGALAAPAALPALGHAALSHATHGGMWLSHAAAALLTVVFLRHGEAAALRLLAAIRLRITALTGLVVVPVAAPSRIDAVPAPWPQAVARQQAPLPVRHHRGPPRAIAAV